MTKSIAKVVKRREKPKKHLMKIKNKASRFVKGTTKLEKVCKDRGVVYIHPIPHGFYEKQIYDYFKQFGKVTRIKLPRNKNGNGKGYAFIEFELKEVATIAAEAMNNYLMFDCLVKAHYIPPEKQKVHAFRADIKPWAKDTSKRDVGVKNRKMDRVQKNKPVENVNKFKRKLARKLQVLRKKLPSGQKIEYQLQVDNTVELVNNVQLNVRKEHKGGKQSIGDADESDDIRVRKPPSVAGEMLRSSGTKVAEATKVLKKKATDVKRKAAKVTKKKATDVKRKAAKVIKKKATNVKTKTTKVLKQNVSKSAKALKVEPKVDDMRVRKPPSVAGEMLRSSGTKVAEATKVLKKKAANVKRKAAKVIKKTGKVVKTKGSRAVGKSEK